MENFFKNIRKYAGIVADVVFLIGALTAAIKSFTDACDQRFPDDKNNVK